MSADNSQPFTDQRSIILLGETGAGKSSFGNFLLNRESFATGSGMLSTTQKVEQQSCQYTEDNLNIQLHVFDLPGLNDPGKIDTTHLNNTYSALKEFSKCMSTLFAIVIDISEPEELESAVKEIHSFLNKISLPDFNITENALLVFSNAHKLRSTREIQDSSVFRVFESCPSLNRLWTIVRYRHVLVDSVCYATDREYWLEKMREIITFTRPRVRVLLLGPHNTAQNDVLKLLRSKKSEMGGEENLPGYDENKLEEVSLEFEGMSLSFQKSVNFLTIENVPESECLEKNNALNQLTSLIQALTETHTFTAFCVLVRMDTKLKYTFIEGIRALANAISEDNPNQFYDRCFFLFTHPNVDNSIERCDLLFSKLSDMKQMRADMGNRVSILNLQSQSATQDILCFLRQTVTFSHAMKQECYGKGYVSNLLSKKFDLSAPPPEPTTSSAICIRSTSTPGSLTLGGGVLALAGAATLITAGAAIPFVAPALLVIESSIAYASIAYASIASASLLSVAIAAPVIAPTVIAPSVLTALSIAGVGAHTAIATTLLYKLIARRKKKKQELEYEYDITAGSFK